MVVCGEHKADAGVVDALADLFGIQGVGNAHFFHHVGGAAGGGNRTAAVFGDFGACGCGDKHGGGGDIEGFGTIAAGTDDVDQMGWVGYGNRRGKFTHHAGGGADFGNGFDFNTQAGEDGGDLFGRNLAAHNLAHQVAHFVVE